MSSQPLDVHFGLELTFIPKKRGAWQEFRSRDEADKYQQKLQELIDAKTPCGVKPFTVKRDLFRAASYNLEDAQLQPHQSYCIEVMTQPKDFARALQGYWADKSGLGGDWNFFTQINYLFEAAKSLNLHPHIERRSKNGKKIWDYPTGGGHIHTELTGLAPAGGVYHYCLYLAERAICNQFANNPWIRWLFAQWSDDTNSAVGIPYSQIDDILNSRVKERALLVSHTVLLTSHSICQRLSSRAKSNYPTYEWRFFDMPRNADELYLQLRFLNNWLASTFLTTDSVDDIGKMTPIWDKSVYSLTKSEFTKLATDPKYALRVAYDFMQSIHLTDDEIEAIFDAFWERNYLRRVKYGKPL